MTQTTEAACLLQSGSMYHRRLGFRTRSGQDIFAGIKPGAFSIYFGDAPIYHFDLDGRWQRSFVEGVHYLKGLDTVVQSLDREREGGVMVLRRKTLPFGQAGDLDDSIRSMALGLIADLDADRLEILSPPTAVRPLDIESLRSLLERVASWDAAAWFAHRERYLATYGPIPFLPPDCLNAVVLQATLGDRDDRRFGGGRPAEHYVRSREEFEDHLGDVSRLLGRRIAQCRGIFVGGADFLLRPVDEVVDSLRVIGNHFPVGMGNPGQTEVDRGSDGKQLPRPGLVHAFLDNFSESLPDRKAWEKFGHAKLGGVSLGIESGDPATLSLFGKSWSHDRLQLLVDDLKAARIGVGLVVLIGAGGRKKADGHVAETAALINSLSLERSDIVSLVDVRSLADFSGTEIDPLSDDETVAQVASIKERVSGGRPSKGPKLVAYNPDKQAT